METKLNATEARRRAKQNYNKNNYDRINFYTVKGKKELYTELAAAAGYKNIGPYIEDLIDTVAASQGYTDRLKEINGGTINRQRKEMRGGVIHEATPEAAGVFVEIVKG